VRQYHFVNQAINLLSRISKPGQGSRYKFNPKVAAMPMHGCVLSAQWLRGQLGDTATSTTCTSTAGLDRLQHVGAGFQEVSAMLPTDKHAGCFDWSPVPVCTHCTCRRQPSATTSILICIRLPAFSVFIGICPFMRGCVLLLCICCWHVGGMPFGGCKRASAERHRPHSAT
jgi:hypothetical protein